MGLVTLIPVALFSFLGGATLGKSRRPLSMLPPGSPLPGVPRRAWREFVSVMVVSPAPARSHRGRLGLFGMTPRHLSDVGFMAHPRKCVVAGEPGVWTGDWRAPLNEKKFLESVPIQYGAFTRSMRKISTAAAPHVGAVVDGEPASLSGLLAVGYAAGARGIAGWVAQPDVRQKFVTTTTAFKKANKIF